MPRPKKTTKQSLVVLDAEPKKELKKNQPTINIGTLNLVTNPLKERYAGKKLHIIFDILIVAGLVFLLAVNFRLWLPDLFGPTDLAKVEIMVSPAPITSGAKINYLISYQNESTKLLKNVSLAVKLPVGFEAEKFLPDSFDSRINTLRIGDLEAGANGQLEIRGRILAPINEEEKITAFLNYTNDRGATKQQIFTSSYLVESSIIEATLDLPKSLSNFEQFTANLAIKNKSNYALNNIKLAVAWPKEFVLLNSEVKPNENNNVWIFDNLSPGEIKILPLRGKFISQGEKQIAISTELSALKQDQYLLQEKKDYPITISFSELKISLETKSKVSAVSPGQELTYEVTYQNNEKYNLANLNLALRLASEFIDWDYLGKKYKLGADKTIPLLGPTEAGGALALGKERKAEITIKLLPAVKLDQTEENGFVVKANVEATYSNPTTGKLIYTESAPLETKINSDLKIKSFALYYTKEGDQLGVGPLPPQVGKTTKYWLFLQAHNTTNQINNAEVTAHLPPGVELTGKNILTDGTLAAFDAQTRIIKWTIDQIPANVPEFYPGPEARLEIAVKPTNQDIGKALTLLDQVKISGTDAFTGARLEATGDNATTDIFENKKMGMVK